MTHDAESVKRIIKTFIDEHSGESTYVQGTDGVMILANKAIFDIESFLVTIRNAYDINTRFDSTIVSDNILAHFNKSNAQSGHRAGDYQYNFLHHLASEYTVDVDLFKLIDSFIVKFKHQFNLADIVITNTGATRCKTNIRFALNTLRDFGLVISRDPGNKRSWSPSVLGLVTLLNIEFNKPHSLRWKFYRRPDQLVTPGTFRDSIYNDSPLDTLLLTSQKQFRNPAHLYSFFTWQSDYALDKSEKNMLQEILEAYFEFTKDGLIITNNGVKMSKVFKEKSDEFQEKLFEQQQIAPTLQEKLFAHFRAVKKNK